MAFIVIEVNAPGLQINDLNDKCELQGDKGDALNGTANLLMALASSNIQGTVQLTSRVETASISTDADPNSKQITY